MARRDRVIGVRTPAGVEWHAAGDAGCGYDTQCAMDANDPAVGTFGTVEPTAAQRITCAHCYSLWKGWQKVRKADFDPTLEAGK